MVSLGKWSTFILWCFMFFSIYLSMFSIFFYFLCLFFYLFYFLSIFYFYLSGNPQIQPFLGVPRRGGCDGNMDPMRDIWLAGLWLWCCHRRSDSRHLGPWLRKRSFRVFMENMWRIFGQVEAALFSIRIQQQRWIQDIQGRLFTLIAAVRMMRRLYHVSPLSAV